MMKTCTMCTRRAPSTFFVDGLCKPCADAVEASGVEVPGYEPSPRKHQRAKTKKTRTKGAKKR